MKDMDVDAPEIKPEVVIGDIDIPKVAMGLNGGMAPKVDEVSQEYNMDIQECKDQKTPKNRKEWCTTKFGDSTNADQCANEFCDFCCDFKIPPTKRNSLKNKCVKICDSSKAEAPKGPPESPEEDVCSNPANLNYSIYK